MLKNRKDGGPPADMYDPGDGPHGKESTDVPVEVEEEGQQSTVEGSSGGIGGANCTGV